MLTEYMVTGEQEPEVVKVKTKTKKKWFVLTVFVVILGVIAMCEWRYSDDMKEHIATVNADMESAQLQSVYSTGLVGMLRSLTSRVDVAGEILDTHHHVHTLKDEMLALRIKNAVKNSYTVGQGIGAVIAVWNNEKF